MRIDRDYKYDVIMIRLAIFHVVSIHHFLMHVDAAGRRVWRVARGLRPMPYAVQVYHTIHYAYTYMAWRGALSVQ